MLAAAVLVLLCYGCCYTEVVALIPIVDWHCSPVPTNSTVMVSGDFSGVEQQQLFLVYDHHAVREPLHGHVPAKRNNSLYFLLPSSPTSSSAAVGEEQLRPFDVVNGLNETVLRGNIPEPWWWLGNRGAVSTAGGWIRVIGRALRGTETKLRLRSTNQPGGLVVTLKASRQPSDYDAHFELPPELPTGTYNASISNGLRDESLPYSWVPLVMFLNFTRYVVYAILPA
jgi:hypothetical protein